MLKALYYLVIFTTGQQFIYLQADFHPRIDPKQLAF